MAPVLCRTADSSTDEDGVRDIIRIFQEISIKVIYRPKEPLWFGFLFSFFKLSYWDQILLIEKINHTSHILATPPERKHRRTSKQIDFN